MSMRNDLDYMAVAGILSGGGPFGDFQVSLLLDDFFHEVLRFNADKTGVYDSYGRMWEIEVRLFSAMFDLEVSGQPF